MFAVIGLNHLVNLEIDLTTKPVELARNHRPAPPLFAIVTHATLSINTRPRILQPLIVSP